MIFPIKIDNNKRLKFINILNKFYYFNNILIYFISLFKKKQCEAYLLRKGKCVNLN